jgi:hypothetical protein
MLGIRIKYPKKSILERSQLGMKVLALIVAAFVFLGASAPEGGVGALRDGGRRVSASTLQSYLNVDQTSPNMQEDVSADGIKAVIGKDPIFGDIKKYPVKVINLELKENEPGTLNDILKIIGENDELISFQLFKKRGHEILSFRVQSKESFELTEDQLRKMAEIHVRVMDRSETIFDIAAPQDYSSRSKDHDYFYLSLAMPYNTHNLIVLTDVLKGFGLSITSFLFPDYEDELKDSIFHFEVCVKRDGREAGYWQDTFLEITRVLKQAIITQCSGCTDKDSIVFERDTTIAENLIEGLLEELAVDLRNYKPEFVDAFKLVSDKIPVLRKDHRTPYVVHLLKAVKILVNEFGIKDSRAIIALLLHDAVEDKSISLEELRKHIKSPDIILIIELITRNYKGDKRFDRELLYLDQIAYAQDVFGIITKLCKIADRVQNLRSLDIGDPKFHRKIFFETLNTFIPNFIDHPEMNIANVPEDFQAQFSLARDTLFAEVMLRGMRFGFIKRDGTISRRQFGKYIEEQAAYLPLDDADEAVSLYQSEIAARYSYEFYQNILDKHKEYNNAIYATIKLWELINSSKYQPLYDYFVSTETKAPFFPKRIKSSTVVFMYRLFDYYKTLSIDKNLESIFLKDIASFEILEHDLILSFQELSKPENMKNYLVQEIAQKFNSYVEDRRTASYEIWIKIFRSTADNTKSKNIKKERELLFSLFREVFIVCMQGYTGRDFNEIYNMIPKRRGVKLERRLLPSGRYFISGTAVVDASSRFILKILLDNKIDATYRHLYPGSSAKDRSDIEKRRDCFAEIVKRSVILGDLSVKSLSADDVEVDFEKKRFRTDILVQEYVVPLQEYIRELFKMKDIEKIKQVLDEYFVLQKKIWAKGYYDENGLLHNYGFNRRVNKVQIFGLVNLGPLENVDAMESLKSYQKIILNNRTRLDSIETSLGSKGSIMSAMFKDAFDAADPINELSRIYGEYKSGPDMSSSTLRSA